MIGIVEDRPEVFESSAGLKKMYWDLLAEIPITWRIKTSSITYLVQELQIHLIEWSLKIYFIFYVLLSRGKLIDDKDILILYFTYRIRGSEVGAVS